MSGVKKSIYLAPDLDEALRASAERDGRSVTKQIDVLLRNALGQQESHRKVARKPPADSSGFSLTLVKPDPKIKASSKKLR